MTPFQSKTPDNRPDAEKQQASERDRRRAKLREKLKFAGFVSLLVFMCAGFIMFIFKPEGEKKAEGTNGYNYSVPEASVEDTEGDKRKALENAELQNREGVRVRSLEQFGAAFGLSEPQTAGPEPSYSAQAAAQSSGDPIRGSQQSAMMLNEQLRSFYDEPEKDSEIADLRGQVEELTELVRLQQQMAAAPQTVDEVALLEKSFEMASRYMPGQSGVPAVSPQAAAKESRKVAGVRRADGNPVSSLAEVELTAQERNYGFMTAVGGETVAVSNAIRACVDEDVVVRTGAQVRLRLLEPLSAGGYLIPVNTSLYGNVRIEGERLSLVVTSIESEGNIIPVELTVHDMDGQTGLNVPGSMERTAAKEALASIGQSFGSSISFARDARQQVAMDLTRGLMNGASQYLSQKMREVKINLKAGYQVLLIAKE